MEDNRVAHQCIDEAFQAHPELFPSKMSEGYMLNGKTRMSKKLGVHLRKIKVAGVSYQLRPGFLFFMRAKSDQVSKTLFLLRFGVPFWALAFVFGRNAIMLCGGIACIYVWDSVVGTTVYQA